MIIKILTTTKVAIERDKKLNVDILKTETIFPVGIYDSQKLIKDTEELFRGMQVDISLMDIK